MCPSRRMLHCWILSCSAVVVMSCSAIRDSHGIKDGDKMSRSSKTAFDEEMQLQINEDGSYALVLHGDLSDGISALTSVVGMGRDAGARAILQVGYEGKASSSSERLFMAQLHEWAGKSGVQVIESAPQNDADVLPE